MSTSTNKPTMALLTTWDEVCGIAHYAYFLKRALDPHFDITVFPTPRSVFMQISDPDEERAADQFAADLQKKISGFDYVNVQYEPGILGRTMARSADRLITIISGAKNLVVTFHAVARLERGSFKEHLQLWLRGRPHRSIIKLTRYMGLRWSWGKIYRYLTKMSERTSVGIITHTKRDARFLSIKMPRLPVFDVPLIFIDDAYRAEMQTRYSSTILKTLLPKPSQDTRYIGCFGFYSEYKGFETAIETLRHLPKNYELLLFSSLHESTLGPEQRRSEYLQRLIDLTKKRSSESAASLMHRVHFLGAVPDDDLILGMMVCDAVLFPYINSNHTASGPTAIALDLGRRVFASRNIQFIELAKYRGAVFEFCDLSNPMEYAQKIIRMTQDREDCVIDGIRIVKYPPVKQTYTPKQSAETYLRAFGCCAE